MLFILSINQGCVKVEDNRYINYYQVVSEDLHLILFEEYINSDSNSLMCDSLSSKLNQKMSDSFLDLDTNIKKIGIFIRDNKNSCSLETILNESPRKELNYKRKKEKVLSKSEKFESKIVEALLLEPLIVNDLKYNKILNINTRYHFQGKELKLIVEVHCPEVPKLSYYGERRK